MIAFIVLLAIWPFHAKKQAPIESPSPCEIQGDLYFYMAEDGAIAFSHESCEAAKFNTDIARQLNQFKMSNI